MAEGTSLSYTGRDNIDIRRELLSLVPQITENWKDFNESDLGVTIVELIAGAQDLQNFYFDNQAFETFLDTAQQDKNIRSHLRAMNYRIPFMGSAKGEVYLYFEKEQRDLRIPKYTQLICNDNDIKYAVADTVYLDALTVDGDTTSKFYNKYKGSKPVPVLEGTVRSFKVMKRNLSSKLTVDGNVSRRIYFEGGDSHNYSDGSLWINHLYGAGERKDEVKEIWTEVDDAILEYNGGTVYSVHMDSDGEPYILMSVNFLDYFDETDVITIYWVQTLGTKGLAIPGTDSEILRFITFKDNNKSNITVYQREATSGAYDLPDLQSLKPLARRQTQNLGRYITIDDYKNGVATEPYVFRSVVKDWKSPSYVSLPYQVKIWAINEQGTNLSSTDIKSLKSKFYSKGVTDIEILYMLTNFVKVRIDVELVLKVSTEANQESLRSLVKDYLTDMLDYLNLDYGEHISLMLLDSQVKSISSYIKYANINLYVGDTQSIEQYAGYSDSGVSSIQITSSMSVREKQEAVQKVHDKIDYGLIEVADDYNINELSKVQDLEVITWKEVGDVVLDEVEFPYIYQINITSTQEDSGVEL